MTYLPNVQQPWEPPAQPRRGMPWWGWLLLGLGAVVVLPCIGCIGWLLYVGSVGPETSVYAGNRVPNRYIEVLKDVGGLEEGEQLRYFYSDAMTDIRNGFYYVSDRKVVVYIEDAGGGPLTIVEFDQIADTDLARDESFFVDSYITLNLKDGSIVSFPVSSESDGDVRFHDALRKEIGGGGGDSDQ